MSQKTRAFLAYMLAFVVAEGAKEAWRWFSPTGRSWPVFFATFMLMAFLLRRSMRVERPTPYSETPGSFMR